MRWSSLLVLAACGGPQASAPATATPGSAATTGPAKRGVRADRAVVDPIVALTPTDEGDVSWLAPGKAQLELDGAPIENPGGGKPIEVTIFDTHGSRVRVALRFEHARFSLWTDRNRLFGVMRRRYEVKEHAGGGSFPGEVGAQINSGARVKRIGKSGVWTKIRYFGALEIEGWVPDDAVADEGPRHEYRGRFPSGRRTLMVTPGAVLRTEPKWTGDELAVMANGYFLDTVKELEDGWTEVSYEDGDITVRGFVSKRLPPGQVHRPHTDPEIQPVPVTPNAKVASGTCLYSRVKGEPIGYIVGDREVDLADADLGWYTMNIDSPWGPIAFAARGATRTDLAACAPAGTVPPPAPPPPPSPPVSGP